MTFVRRATIWTIRHMAVQHNLNEVLYDRRPHIHSYSGLTVIYWTTAMYFSRGDPISAAYLPEG